MKNIKKILLLGTDTMLGHVIYLYFKRIKNYRILDYYLNENFSGIGNKIDIASPKKIENLLSGFKETIIINTLSILIEESNNKFDKAIYINSYLPNYIATLLKDTDNKLITISTDCVFSGKKGDYLEESLSDAKDNYGKTKAFGEINNAKDLTIRTSKLALVLKINQKN
ncbi:MAG: sugar nucleotide-binding protein [Ignavibacteriae bacterium]|nr:sugar nucleotide-binding protein [Ignavibacteriota bacterium]